MLSLCIDTAYKYLCVCLISDDKIVDALSFECYKRQSEEVFVALDKLFKRSGINKADVDSICISKGPGSYTGVRIAMSLAKVYCQVKKIKLYTLSTLRLYAGNKANTMVIMDARANRAYVGIYDKGEVVLKDCIKEIKDIEVKDCSVLLDGHLLGKQDVVPDIPDCFLKLKDKWEEVKDINFLVPEYLKESESYYR